MSISSRPGEAPEPYTTVLAEHRGAVGIVTLNRPDRMNAWVHRLGLEVRHAICAFDADESIRCIVVTGAGRAFCAGADLEPTSGLSADVVAKEQARLAEVYRPASDRPYWDLATPIIAAMNGSAVGVGLTFPLQLDMRIVAENAKYGFAFTRRGRPPELGSSWLLARLVGAAKALEMLLSSATFSGARAAELGIANEACPADQVLPRALEIAEDIAENVSPLSAAITKRLVYRFLEEPDRNAAARLEEEIYVWAKTQDDSREGVASFLEKRPPQWQSDKNADFPWNLLGEDK